MSAPIGNTCPDINKAIKELEPLIKTIDHLHDYQYEDAEYMKNLLSDCHYAMEFAIRSFEDLRRSNDTLRSWGQQMEEEAEGMQVKYDEMREMYEEMEWKMQNEESKKI